ncbi:THAP domain-containing protein 2 [Merluccius polli]|uniref:THAP domain-containing protein 1 n=1 Tax=Merluccius polli TaxID=89951 RepID=A0AA47PD02_MERPO|nr:THAP domain-containing protein 2 [Merluccius polli]
MSVFRVKERQLAYQKISFHSFPLDSALRAEWMRTIRRDNFTPTKNTRVCSRHFNATDIIVTPSGLRRLQKGTIPVLNGMGMSNLQEDPVFGIGVHGLSLMSRI